MEEESIVSFTTAELHPTDSLISDPRKFAHPFVAARGAYFNGAQRDRVKTMHGTDAMDAAWHGDVEAMESALCDAHPNLNAVDKDGFSALHIAAHRGHKMCVEMLLEHGAPVSLLSNSNKSALHCASGGYHDNAEVISVLMLAGADCSPHDKNESAPLHEAAFLGHSEIISELLRWGAHVDERNNNSETPLMLAAKNNHVRSACILASYGASIHACGSETATQTPLIVAKARGWDRALVEAARGPNLPTKPECIWNRSREIKLKWADVLPTDPTLTPHFSSKIERSEIQYAQGARSTYDLREQERLSQASVLSTVEAQGTKSTVLSDLSSLTRSCIEDEPSDILDDIEELSTAPSSAVPQLQMLYDWVSFSEDLVDRYVTVTDLLPAAFYIFRARFRSMVGWGDFSPTAVFRTLEEPPARPDPPKLIKRTHEELFIHWDPPEAYGLPILYYHLQWRLASFFGGKWHTVDKHLEAQDYCLGGLQPLSYYRFRVRARSPSGWGKWCIDSDSMQTDCIGSVKLTKPVAGAVWKRGEKGEIQWFTNEEMGDTVVVTLWQGERMMALVDKLAKNLPRSSAFEDETRSGTLFWEVPSQALSGDDYYIRVTGAISNVTATSEKFSIVSKKWEKGIESNLFQHIRSAGSHPAPPPPEYDYGDGEGKEEKK